MGPQLARYVARSPRYILHARDNTLIRVAGPHQTPWEEGTEIRDLSMSGLAFTAPNFVVPILGEPIKVQFDVPGAGSMACFAIVTRIEQGPTVSLVAVKFAKMDAAQKIYLADNLRSQLKSQTSRERRAWLWSRFSQGYKKMAAIVLLLVCWTLVNWFWFSVLPKINAESAAASQINSSKTENQ